MEINERDLTLLEQTNPGAFTISKVTPNGIEMLYASPEAARVVGMHRWRSAWTARSSSLSGCGRCCATAIPGITCASRRPSGYE